MPVRRTLNQDFFKAWSPKMAYVLGYFAADGSMLRNRRGACFIEFTTTDKILVVQLRKSVCSNHKLTVRSSTNVKWKTQYRLQIGSKEWFGDLLKLGFSQKKSKTLKLPKIPKGYFPHFLRGYFDGDGNVSFGRYWSKSHRSHVWVFTTRFTSGSRIFLESLLAVLRSRGVKGGYVTVKERGYELVFSRRDSLALYSLMYHTAQISDLFLPRKQRVFERAIRVLKLRS